MASSGFDNQRIKTMKIIHQINRTAISYSVAAFALAGMTGHAKNAPGLHDFKTLNAAPAPVIIVVRHGQDIKGRWIESKEQLTDTWKDMVPTWPTYQPEFLSAIWAMPSNVSLGSLTLFQHGLSPEGEAQAEFLGKNLTWLVKELNGVPITRVITKRPDMKNPDGSNPTPNPFDTIFPFLKYSGFKGELILIDPGVDKAINPLVDKGLATMLPDFEAQPPNTGSLLNGTGSTLVCWDAEGLWGKDETVVNGESYRTWSENNILNKLATPAIDDHLMGDRPDLSAHEFAEGKGVPGKAARIYVFYPRANPTGYDCIVVDVTNRSGQPEFEMIAELWIDEEEALSTKFPAAVLKDLEQPDSQAALPSTE